MRNKIIALFFCLMLAVGTGLSLFLPDKYYSESERRTLTQKPKFSLSRLVSGKLGTDIESYLADQFPARDAWITVKTLSERAAGKKESGGVYFADDGYLIEQFNSYDQKQFATNLEALSQLTKTLAEQGITVRVMLVPTATEILADKLPHYAPHISQQSLLDAARRAGLNVVDVSDALSAHKDEYIYYKTDHHFTSLGAYYCYAAWKAAKGETAEAISAWRQEMLCDNFRGTTYAKVNDPFAPCDIIWAYYKTEKHTVNYNAGNYITDSIYERKYLSGKDPYAAFLNSNQAQTVVSGEGEGRLLIIKDSYANTFAQFVVDEYEQTHLIDPRFYRGSVSAYAAENGITEVLVLYNIPNFAGDSGVAMVR